MSGNVKSCVEEMLRPFEAEGFEIWNVEFVKEGRERQLRVFADRNGGIGLDDCERLSRYLSERLDENDVIEEAYSLIVSSPGMDRQLLTDGHFERYAGQAVEVSLYRGFEGRKKFAAILGTKTAEALFVTPIDRATLRPECGELAVPAELVSKVNLMVVI